MLEDIQEIILESYLTGAAGEFGFFITICGEKQIGKTSFLEFILRKLEETRRIIQISKNVAFPSEKRIQILNPEQTDFPNQIKSIILQPQDVIVADEIQTPEELFPFFNFALRNKVSAIAVHQSSYQNLPREISYPHSLTIFLSGNEERKMFSFICHSNSNEIKYWRAIE